MPNYVRARVPGGTYFFTVALADRGATTLVDEVDALREAVRRTRAERPFGIDAWVVLPDHLHCVWRLPEGDADYATRWRLIKARFSMAVEAGRRRPSHVRRGERAVWQRRYWERAVRDEREWRACVTYCAWNPVKHGFVDRPEAWRWSSVQRQPWQAVR